MRNALILLLVGLMFFSLPNEIGFISGVVLSIVFRLYVISMKYVGVVLIAYGFYKIIKAKFGKK